MKNCWLDNPVSTKSGEDSLTILGIAATVREVVGEIVFDTSKPYGMPRKLMDVSRLHAMGWRASTQMQAGLNNAYIDTRLLPLSPTHWHMPFPLPTGANGGAPPVQAGPER